MNETEIIKLIEATQDGRNLEDTHPISRLIKWAITDEPTEDFDLGVVLSNLEYAIAQLEAAKTMVKLVRHVSNDRGQ